MTKSSETQKKENVERKRNRQTGLQYRDIQHKGKPYTDKQVNHAKF